MELTRLIASLSCPVAYPFPVEAVEVCQTHISVVFLAGPLAYKVKKPVRFEFLDFSTLEKRRHFCLEEVRLNRRLAPDVYLGVVPITESGSGLRMEGEGAVVEWAVKMHRLPEAATLRECLRRGEVTKNLIERLAARIAAFHRQTPVSCEKAGLARFQAVSRNLLDVYDQTAGQVGTTVSPRVHGRLRGLVEEALGRLVGLIEARAEHGKTCDGHGDLHLSHIYSFPDCAPPADVLVIDCIEFSDRFRFLDPVADIAFLVMDLSFHGQRDLARAFADAYFRSSRDSEGSSLLPLYVAYRATVRALVEGLKQEEREILEAERRAAGERSRAYWLLALGELERPARRPCLVLLGGLPGTGKSTLARRLADNAGFVVVRSDEVRKELAGLSPHEPVSPAARPTLYSTAMTERTYAECLRRVEALLFQGRRVLVDATFREERHRRAFLDAAARWRVPGVLLLCKAEPDTVRERLQRRQRDASDADWSVYRRVASFWEAPGSLTQQTLHEVPTGGSSEEALCRCHSVLAGLGLWKRCGAERPCPETSSRR